MNKYFYSAIIMIFSLLPANLLSMKSLNVSKPFQGTTQRFSTNNSSPAQSQPNTTVQIPVESSNQALAKVIHEQKQEQGSSKKSKWYQGKWKYFTGLGAGAATGIGLYYAFNIKLSNILSDKLNNSDDAEILDPELYAVFLKIKKDMGITENIQFRISKPGYLLNNGANAYYNYDFNIIMIDPKFYKNSHPNMIIHTLVHELEHVRQYLGSVGSYPTSQTNILISKLQGKHSKTGAHLKVETGADASAAGYFDCHDCLKNVQKNHGPEYNPSNLVSGYFTTDSGYFAPQDYDSYIERACREGERCKAHQILRDKNKQKYGIEFSDPCVSEEKFPLNFYLPKSAE